MYFIIVIILFLNIYFIFKIKNEKKKISIGLENISIISFDLTGSAEQVTTVSSDLLSSSKEQLDTLSSTVSATHEISAMIMKTSDNTKDLDTNSLELKNMSVKGQNIVLEMVDSSLKIKEGSEIFLVEMKESIYELSNTLLKIQEIADKTKVINEIVFQTKLLSFNASVEAARAGIHGKGFAVVAEEIGKLAEMSGKSSIEISQIVEQSVEYVNVALEKTKNKVSNLTSTTLERSQTGFNHAKNCELIFSSITDKICVINNMAKEISLATSEQAQGVELLNFSILNLQEVANRNQLVASQTTQHAHAFQNQAQELIAITKEMRFLLPMRNKSKAKLQQFIWNNKLILGVDIMDDEHKILVSKINKLVESLEEQYINKNKVELLKYFKDLADYTKEHFDHEEKFMNAIGYAQYPSHKKIHEKLLEQVASYGKQIEKETLDDQKLISFLRNWLISHIMGVDMQYADYYSHTAVSSRMI